jgi:uncharacterized protein (TIGR01244 family)
MDMRRINDMFSIAGQITTADVNALAQLGFKTIICNRPDGEDIEQTKFSDISALSKKKGIRAHMLPISRTGVTPEQQKSFDHFLFECPKPVFAYCHSGTRSAILWGAFNVDYNYKYMGPERRKARASIDADNPKTEGAQHRRRTSDYDLGMMEQALRKTG